MTGHHIEDLWQSDPRWHAHGGRPAVSFAFSAETYQPWGGLDPVLDWCRDYLTEEWRWELIEVSTGELAGRYRFYFDGSKDACAFLLKWC
jgi:hypothetical protein